MSDALNGTIIIHSLKKKKKTVKLPNSLSELDTEFPTFYPLHLQACSLTMEMVR